MKISRVIVFLVFVLFRLPSFGQSDTVYNQRDSKGLKQGYWKRTMTNNGTTYLYAIESFKDDKRNGFCVYFFPSGRKEVEANYRNDTLDGISRVYKSYGGIRYEEPFKDGRTHGFKKYYDVDGNLSEEQEYVEGVPTGVYRLYYKNGRLRVESYYIDGIENGTRRVYADNAKQEIIREFDFKNDVKIAERYYKKGKIVKEQSFDYDEGLKKEMELKEKNKRFDG